MEAVKKALKAIVANRDFSLKAVQALESEIAALPNEDERFEELEHILASYRPGGGEFLYDKEVLLKECERVIQLL